MLYVPNICIVRFKWCPVYIFWRMFISSSNIFICSCRVEFVFVTVRKKDNQKLKLWQKKSVFQ